MEIFTVIFHYTDTRGIYPVSAYVTDHLESFTTFTAASNHANKIFELTGLVGEIQQKKVNQ